jgi:hypothetical protein
VFELPFLRSLGVEPRYVGRLQITALLQQLLKLYPNFAFAPDDIHILIETPEKMFAEYVAHARAAATGRTLHHLFTGYLVAKAGEIKLLRESFNPLAMAQAQLGYWKTGARRSPATISTTLTGATPPRRSLRFWRNYGPTLINKRGDCDYDSLIYKGFLCCFR